MELLYELLAKTVDVNFWGKVIPVPYIEVSVILVLLFLLVLTMAQYRHHTVHYSFKGAGFGILFGFMLALTLEGFLLVKGSTAITALLGWKNAPKPLSVALDSGRNKLTEVLGIQDAANSIVKASVPQEAIKVFQSLTPQDREKIKSLICAP